MSENLLNVFSHGYPYTDNHELNLSWVIEKIQELNVNLDTLEARVLETTIAAAKEYVDQEVAAIEEDFNTLSLEVAGLRTYFDDKVEELEDNYDTFVLAVRYQLDMMTARIDAFDQTIQNDIIGVNALTDLKIQQNNEYILDQVAQGLVNVRVLNFFTGDYVTVQEMFNYLCGLHASDTPTIQEMIDANKTVQELINLNHTVGDWVRYGKQYI